MIYYNYFFFIIIIFFIFFFIIIIIIFFFFFFFLTKGCEWVDVCLFIQLKRFYKHKLVFVCELV